MVRLIESSVNRRSVWAQCSTAVPLLLQGEDVQSRRSGASLHQRGSGGSPELAGDETNRSPFGLTRGTKHLPLERIETVRRREEAEATAIADDDPRRLGADLDDVGVGHCAIPSFIPGRITELHDECSVQGATGYSDVHANRQLCGCYVGCAARHTL